MAPSYAPNPTPTKPRPNNQSHGSHIKTERKNITQSILAVQRSGSFNYMKSDDPIKTATHMRSEDDFRESGEECN